MPVVFVEGGREPAAPEEWADQVPQKVHPQNLLILLRVMMPLLLLALVGPGCDCGGFALRALHPTLAAGYAD